MSVILRTKAEIIAVNDIIIEPFVLEKLEFKEANIADLFALIFDGYKVVDFKKIENDDDFFDYTFGYVK